MATHILVDGTVRSDDLSAEDLGVFEENVKMALVDPDFHVFCNFPVFCDSPNLRRQIHCFEGADHAKLEAERNAFNECVTFWTGMAAEADSNPVQN